MGSSNLANQIPLKNVEDIINGISSFVQYWDRLRVVDVGGSFCHQYGTWIRCWTRILKLWWTFINIAPPPLLWGVVLATKLCNREVREEFHGDNHYVGPASNRPLLCFLLAVDCQEGCMLILRPGDEACVKQLWVARALSQPNFVISNPQFQQIK